VGFRDEPLQNEEFLNKTFFRLSYDFFIKFIAWTDEGCMKLVVEQLLLLGTNL
jgi:hypothetical protein